MNVITQHAHRVACLFTIPEGGHFSGMFMIVFRTFVLRVITSENLQYIPQQSSIIGNNNYHCEC